MRFRGRVKKWVYGRAGAFPYFGTRVYFPPGSHLFDRACHSGIYEPELVGLLSRLIRPGTTYIDVGANIGLTSVPVLAAVPACSVISFEPSPNNLPYLTRTARESPYAGRWQVVGAMAGPAPGVSEFHLSAAADGAFDGSRPTGRVATAGTAEVPVTTVDREWEARGRPDVSAVKIDVEGGELGVLAGAAECLRAARPFVVLEWNVVNLKAHGVALPDLLGWVTDARYSVLRLPEMTPVRSAGELRATAVIGIENFFLSPDD